MSLSSVPVTEALGRLRSRQRFDPQRAIPSSVLTQILELAAHVPSWNDLQPWRFLVIRNARNRSRLRSCVFDRREVVEAPVVVVVLGYLHPHRTHLAPLLGKRLALGQINQDEAAKLRIMTQRRMERLEDLEAWASQTAARAETAILIAAAALGVDSAPIEEFEVDKLAKSFGIPDDHVPCGIVALGYATGDEPQVPPLSLDELCFAEHFGQPWSEAD